MFKYILETSIDISTIKEQRRNVSTEYAFHEFVLNDLIDKFLLMHQMKLWVT